MVVTVLIQVIFEFDEVEEEDNIAKNYSKEWTDFVIRKLVFSIYCWQMGNTLERRTRIIQRERLPYD